MILPDTCMTAAPELRHGPEAQRTSVQKQLDPSSLPVHVLVILILVLWRLRIAIRCTSDIWMT